eukprot:TRINITY_DN6747_c0_g1_i3.p1 TRINITY_DN6747_c0_g1~~TRINITY_DN6747_c0_g1_i3.p1  ORF type:complete len:574 (+),score=67.12 TRINITY_DN6747_c0_g1_i3:84-1805(+)
MSVESGAQEDFGSDNSRTHGSISNGIADDSSLESIFDLPSHFQRLKYHTYIQPPFIAPDCNLYMCQEKERLLSQIAVCNHILSYLPPGDQPEVALGDQSTDVYTRFHTDIAGIDEVLRVTPISKKQASSGESLPVSEHFPPQHGSMPGFFFSDPIESSLKPYLRTRTIERIKKGHIPMSTDYLQHGDILHVPFTTLEDRIMDDFFKDRTASKANFIEVSKLLPGRSGSDCYRYHLDKKQEKNQSVKGCKSHNQTLYFAGSRRKTCHKLVPLLNHRQCGITPRESFIRQYRRNLVSSIRSTSSASDPSGSINDVHFNPSAQAKQLLVGSMSNPNAAVLYNFRRGRPAEKISLNGHTDGVLDSRYFPAGDCIATASADRSICIWDSKDGSLLATLTGHQKKVTRLAINPSQSVHSFASIGDDNSLMHWCHSSGGEYKSACLSTSLQETHNIEEIFITNTTAPNYLYALHGEKPTNLPHPSTSAVSIWDLNVSRCQNKVIIPVNVDIMDISHDGGMLIWCINGYTQLFDCRTTKVSCSLSTRASETISVSCHPNGNYIAQGLEDCSVIVTDTRMNS